MYTSFLTLLLLVAHTWLWGGRFIYRLSLGAIQVLRNADEGGGVTIPRKKCYEGVRFNVI